MAANGTADPQLPTSSNSTEDKTGFQRPEMFSKELVGSVKEYNVHVFAVVEKPASEWPKSVEDASFSPVANKIGEVLKARKDEIKKKVKFTVAGGLGADGKDGDVLVLPDMVKYKTLKPEDVDKFVDEALLDSPDKKLATEPLEGDQLFVCAHNSWDERCGTCGPPLIDLLREEIKKRGSKGLVYPCSHIGGHAYAGNVVAYTKKPDGTVAGNWYGYVTPNDVPTLMDAFKKGQIVDKLWRGGLNLTKEGQVAAQQARKSAGCGPACACVEGPVPPSAAAPPPPAPAPGPAQPSWGLSPAKWSPSTRTAVTATAVAVACVGLAWYLRSRAANNPQ